MATEDMRRYAAALLRLKARLVLGEDPNGCSRDVMEAHRRLSGLEPRAARDFAALLTGMLDGYGLGKGRGG